MKQRVLFTQSSAPGRQWMRWMDDWQQN